jgi:hypothetical protein
MDQDSTTRRDQPGYEPAGIQEQRAALINEALEYLDTIARRKPAEQLRAALAEECTRLRQIAQDLADILCDVFVFPPAEDSEQEQLRDELLAEVPAALRGQDDEPDHVAVGAATVLANAGMADVVRDWLRAAHREATP